MALTEIGNNPFGSKVAYYQGDKNKEKQASSFMAYGGTVSNPYIQNSNGSQPNCVFTAASQTSQV